MASPITTLFGEALLRQRLSPAQLADLDNSGTFCVRGSNRALYRICVTRGPDEFQPVMRFVVDSSGALRNFWFLQYRRALGYCDLWESVLAAKVLLEADAQRFETHACHEYRSHYWKPIAYPTYGDDS